jgi:cytochrome c5
MLRLIPIVVLILAGCGETGDEAAPATTSTPPVPTDDTVALTGKQAYDQVCASCHDEGVDGAPRTGDRDAWTGRSWLWEAVLFEHAKDGYLEMPARGGDESLDDATVEMAAEYMLTKTFPDAPPAD